MLQILAAHLMRVVQVLPILPIHILPIRVPDQEVEVVQVHILHIPIHNPCQVQE